MFSNPTTKLETGYNSYLRKYKTENNNCLLFLYFYFYKQKTSWQLLRFQTHKQAEHTKSQINVLLIIIIITSYGLLCLGILYVIILSLCITAITAGWKKCIKTLKFNVKWTVWSTIGQNVHKFGERILRFSFIFIEFTQLDE